MVKNDVRITVSLGPQGVQPDDGVSSGSLAKGEREVIPPPHRTVSHGNRRKFCLVSTIPPPKVLDEMAIYVLVHMVNMALTVEDRLDIVELINRYNTLADERDVEGTLGCYTDDGQITGDFGTGSGKDAMREDLPAIFEAEGTLKRHLALNHQLSGDGESAEARYILAVLEGESIPSVGATAVITDELRKVDGEWLVRRHEVDIDPGMYAAMEQMGQ
jgi:hypothetical protein